MWNREQWLVRYEVRSFIGLERNRLVDKWLRNDGTKEEYFRKGRLEYLPFQGFDGLPRFIR